MPSENRKRRKSKFSLRKLIYNDKYLIVLSVIAAVVIWIATSINLSPETTKSVTVPVTVDFSGTLAEQLGIQYFDSTDITVDVTISCQRYLARDITADDISASLRTDTVTSAGYQSVQILVSTRGTDEFSIESYYPTSVAGLYDVYQEQSFPVQLKYTNTDFCADGYVAGATTLSSDEVLVGGPKTYVSQIDRVEATISLDSNLSESQLVDLAPVALDSSGKKLDYITFENSIAANIPILKVENLSPQVNLVNAPVNVQNIVDIDYSVSRIQAGVLESGENAVLDIGDINFNEISPGKNEFTFDLTQLSGVVVLDGTDEVTVTVTVPDDYETRDIRVSASNVTISPPDGYTAQAVSLPDTTITVVGSSSALENLSSSNLVLSCDFKQNGNSVSTGVNEYVLSVSVNDAPDVWVYGSYTVRVNVTES